MYNEQAPFLVEASDGNLYAYFRKDLLLIDLAINREDPPRHIFRLAERSLSISYQSIEASELTAAAPQPVSAEVTTQAKPLELAA